ncbi:3-phosphoserine/phosphohydroxythreonine transaminase [Granulosicoccaceae sp. 1_MG-2023]|nr:3-phosphoserine/phosphohydroxythreonine transaminase [Granulosicoccaceae sp. 1_MG-2023]
MSRIFNFSAGPAMLPAEVLQQAKDEMLDWHGSGMSVMEMSHRGKDFLSIAEAAEADLRQLLAIPDNYKVLFLQGGASAQFSLIPMNLLGGKPGLIDFVNTGAWSKKAIQAAKNYADVHVVASSEDDNFNSIPAQDSWQRSDKAAYLHLTANETIGGVEFHTTPDSDVPLVADMSSNILSRPVDVSRFGLIYAGAQKNIGPAGLTLVIIRDDLIGEAHPATPDVFRYSVMADTDSMSNTPPTYGWYLAGLVFKWLLAQGGLDAMEARNVRKAGKLYDAIDSSDFYANPVAKDARSRMNVPFTLADGALDKEFLAGAAEAGLTSLKGHRSVGGMRASIYNAMPEEGVDALIAYMRDFEQRRG